MICQVVIAYIRPSSGLPEGLSVCGVALKANLPHDLNLGWSTSLNASCRCRGGVMALVLLEEDADEIDLVLVVDLVVE